MSNTQNTELDFDDPFTDTDEGVEAELINDGDLSDGEGDTTEAGADGEGQADQNDTPVEQVEDEGKTEPELTDEEKAAQAEAEKAAAKAKAEAEEAEREAAVETFKGVVEGVFDHEGYDKATGTLPTVLEQVVIDAYTALPGAKAKNAGRTYLQDSMQAHMIKGTTEGPEFFMRARTYMELNNKVTAAKSSSPAAAKPKVDPTEAHINRIAAMLLAPNFVEVGEEVANGWEAKAEELVASLNEDANKYLTWLRLPTPTGEGETKPDAPEVSEVVIAAAKIAVGRAAGAPRKASTGGTSTPRVSTAGSGHRGDIGKHIREVMDTVSVGDFVTIAEIAKAATSQYGGATMPPPSQGAIAARLFPAKGECTLDFVSPEGKDQGHAVKGAVRTA